MKVKKLAYLCGTVLVGLAIQGCAPTNSACCKVDTRTVPIYEDHSIPANTGISTGVYTEVDGFRYVNVAVEFEQQSAQEEPVSLGVIFAHDQGGEWGSRRYFSFDENFDAPADPQMITLTGNDSWHGEQHQKGSYIARLPVMGPYVQVFPFNHHDEARNVSVVLYLTE